VNVEGDGFKANVTSGLLVDFGGTSYPMSGSTNASGALIGSFVVPTVPDLSGDYSVAVSDGTNTSSAYSSNYRVTPQLLTMGNSSGGATSGTVGTSVTLSGNGFAPDVVSGLSVIIDNTGYALSGSTDGSGSLSADASFTLPLLPAKTGGYSVAVSDGTNTSGSYSATYDISAAIALAANNGTIVVSGTGFAANSTLAVELNGSSVAWTSSGGSVLSGADGSIPAGSSIAAASTPGGNTVTISDAAGDSATASFASG
jgi:hypothetical protein